MDIVGTVTIVLGKEYDDILRRELLVTLQELGAELVDKWQGIAGSQEVERLEAVVQGKTIVVEAETYVGLTVSGDPDIAALVAARVRERMRALDVD